MAPEGSDADHILVGFRNQPHFRATFIPRPSGHQSNLHAELPDDGLTLAPGAHDRTVRDA